MRPSSVSGRVGARRPPRPPETIERASRVIASNGDSARRTAKSSATAVITTATSPVISRSRRNVCSVPETIELSATRVSLAPLIRAGPVSVAFTTRSWIAFVWSGMPITVPSGMVSQPRTPRVSTRRSRVTGLTFWRASCWAICVRPDRSRLTSCSACAWNTASTTNPTITRTATSTASVVTVTRRCSEAVFRPLTAGRPAGRSPGRGRCARGAGRALRASCAAC